MDLSRLLGIFNEDTIPGFIAIAIFGWMAWVWFGGLDKKSEKKNKSSSSSSTPTQTTTTTSQTTTTTSTTNKEQ